jgi:predicted nucleotidyltransferase
MVDEQVRVIERVDEDVLTEVVERILGIVKPEKVMLFGSYASGHPRSGSDLDILIIMPTALPPHQRAVPFYRALAGLVIAKDILVYTPEEVLAWSNVPEALVTTALRDGRVLYEEPR